jgi:hypothetical protein
LPHCKLALWLQTDFDIIGRVKYWEIIADNLSKAGWSWGCVATVDSNGQTIFVADAHRDNGKRFIVTADEKLTAFLELERVTRESGRVEAGISDHVWSIDEVIGLL